MNRYFEKALIILFCLAFHLQTNAFKQTISTKSLGNLTLVCDNDTTGWQFNIATKETGGKEIITLSMHRALPATPPITKLSFAIPQTDMLHLWHTGASVDRGQIYPDWGRWYSSQLAKDAPIYALYNENNENKLTLAYSDASRYINSQIALREEACLITGKINLFTQSEAPISDYTLQILVDKRNCFWAESIKEATEWIVNTAELTPCNTPSAAFDPLYSSWYQFHQEVCDKEIEEECKLASEMGMKTLIVDDGWQTNDNHRGYAFCGDWEICKEKFPNMKAHVEAVHKTGMKYMMWYSVPYVGIHSKAYNQFKDKFLYSGNVAVLDPRFPEVREYLANTYEKAMKEWNLDGFKLDFIDQFKINDRDPAEKDNYAGRDIKSLPDAVNELMKDIVKRLQAINPNVLLEFRQGYIGPSILQYGNMFRAADCPGDPQANRIRTLNLRLTSLNQAVHADMIEWNPTEQPDNVARIIQNALFSTIQYSMMLRTLPKSHLKVIKHWLDFSVRHRETLLHSTLKPYHPELLFPIVEAESNEERIFVTYQDNMLINVGDADKKIIVVNSTHANSIAIKMGYKKTKKAKVYDIYGDLKATTSVKSGLNDISVPAGGYIEF